MKNPTTLNLFTITLYLFVMIMVFFVSTCNAQEFISPSSFKKKIAKDIVAVEFWVGWNASNEFTDLILLEGCIKYRVDVGEYPEVQKEYKVACIPTVIIFENGEEKERFKANIMFQLEADRSIVQNSVDTLILNKFQ